MACQSGGPASCVGLLVISVWGIDTNINNIGLNKCINKQQRVEHDILAPRGHKGEGQKLVTVRSEDFLMGQEWNFRLI